MITLNILVTAANADHCEQIVTLTMKTAFAKAPLQIEEVIRQFTKLL